MKIINMQYLLVLILLLSSEVFSSNPVPVYSCNGTDTLNGSTCESIRLCKDDSSIAKVCKYKSSPLYRWSEAGSNGGFYFNMWNGAIVNYGDGYQYFKGVKKQTFHDGASYWSICRCLKPVVTYDANAFCPTGYHHFNGQCVLDNASPITTDFSSSLNEDVSEVIAASYTDSDSGDTHSITDLTQPENGTVVVSGTNFTFTPDPDWFGTTTFTYRIKDNKDAKSNVATVTLNVNPVNDAPSVTAVTFNLNEDGSQTLTPNILDVDE